MSPESKTPRTEAPSQSTREAITRLCNALGCTPNDLLQDYLP